MVTHADKRSGVALNQALELMAGVLPAEFESWDEVPANYQVFKPDVELLRTPAASEAERGHQPPEKARARGGQVTLEGQARFDDWGKFRSAIERWERILSNSAPMPTEDFANGKRLSSRFAEWMMGLQPGWVTGHGLSRKDELKLCGNGVVPQQAKLALKILLERLDTGV